MTEFVQCPAADCGCSMRLPGCGATACRPDPVPCEEFADLDSEPYCACCGWAEHAHDHANPRKEPTT